MPAKLPVLDTSGEQVSELELSSQIFEGKVNRPLIAQAIKVYLANQRKSYPKTKRRGEVKGSGRKIWPQKGTGQARHGDKYAPIFVGGGIAHGPRGNQNYRKKMPKKMKQTALIAVLTSKYSEGQVKVVKGIKRMKKTKSAVKALKKWFGKEFKPQDKYLLVLPKKLKNTYQAFRNLSYLNIELADSLNVYQVLDHDWLIVTPETVKKLTSRLSK